MSEAGMTDEQRQDELRREIEQTRRDLGETVEALSQKANVKEQVRQKAQDVQQQAREKPAGVGIAAGGIVAGLVALWLIRRRSA
ncbi:MAG TPA: DUF3618 domain-containing protein [Thermoleophilaceae bacterium]|jgi:hypothetical protein|nr:DUF3618 domain-containing protein [Thermoleophilaceae bacterium]